MPLTPEQQAREEIDTALADAGWIVQDRDGMNLAAGLGVAVREFKMAPGHGFADYMLFVNGQAVGVLEAKPVGYTLSSVELQADKYATGLPAGLNPPVNPLPFLYVSTGVDTRFINGLDPDPKSRRISHLPHVHRPDTLAEWARAETLDAWVKRLHTEGGGFYTAAGDTRPASLRARIRTLPPLERDFLYPVQVEAVQNVERSLKRNHPRSLVQMATGPARRSSPSRPFTGSSGTLARGGCCSSSTEATSASRRRRSSRASARRTIIGSSPSSTPSSA